MSIACIHQSIHPSNYLIIDQIPPINTYPPSIYIYTLFNHPCNHPYHPPNLTIHPSSSIHSFIPPLPSIQSFIHLFMPTIYIFIIHAYHPPIHLSITTTDVYNAYLPRVASCLVNFLNLLGSMGKEVTFSCVSLSSRVALKE